MRPIFLSFLLFSVNMLMAQKVTDHLVVEDLDTASISLSSIKDLNSDLETWVSGINFLSHFDDTQLGWSFIADGKERALKLVSTGRIQPSMYLSRDRSVAFGTDVPTANYDFVGNDFSGTLLLRRQFSDKGLLFDSGSSTLSRN